MDRSEKREKFFEMSEDQTKENVGGYINYKMIYTTKCIFKYINLKIF